jgi:hypothetical protein
MWAIYTTLLVGVAIGCSSPDAAPVTKQNTASIEPVKADSVLEHASDKPDSGVVTEGVITLDTAAVQRAGIVSTTLAIVRRAIPVELPGVLMSDPGRVVVIEAPVSGRFSVDGVPGARWPGYDEYMAKGTILGQVSDARPIVVAGSGMVTRIGARPGDIVQVGQQLLELTDFSELLARIAWTGDAPSVPPSTVTIFPISLGLTNRVATVAALLGPAPEVDSLTHAPAYLYRVSTPWRGARPGAPIAIRVTDARSVAHGAVVPTDAVVQWQGLAWAYVERTPGTYLRRRVDTRHRVATGWLVPSVGEDVWGVHAGDRIVVRGAELLLSEEFRSRVTVGEDEDKR